MGKMEILCQCSQKIVIQKEYNLTEETTDKFFKKKTRKVFVGTDDLWFRLTTFWVMVFRKRNKKRF